MYALGAILYECLTGAPPFEGETTMDVLTKVVHREPVPPGQIAGRLPRDLETICLKCLQKLPAKRYGSAQELADDLRRFLDGEPIQARPVNRAERLVKWARRRPTAAALVAVTTIAVVALLGLGAWWNARLRTALDRAEERTSLARSAAEDLYTQLAEEWLGDEPQMDEVRTTFLLKALNIHERMAEDEGDDPELQRERGRAYFRVARIQRDLRRFSEAEGNYEKAIAVHQQLRDEFPSDPRHRQDLASAWNFKGELCRAMSRLPEARDCYRTARDLQQRLVHEFASEPAYRQELARTLYNIGLALKTDDPTRPAQGREEFDEAIRLLTPIVEVNRSNRAAVQGLARAHLNRGTLLRTQGGLTDARGDCEKAIGLLTELVRQAPGKPEFRFELALAHNNLGNLENVRAKDFDRALRSHEEARRLLARLGEDFPARPHYREELANTWNSLGAVLAEKALHAQAEDAWRQAADVFIQLTHESPVASCRHGAGVALFNLGRSLLKNQDQPARAREELEKSVTYLRQAKKIDESNGLIARDLCEALIPLGKTAAQLDDAERAAAAARELHEIAHASDRDLFEAARLLALAAAAAPNVSRWASEERKARGETYARQALAMLEKVDLARHRKALEEVEKPDFAALAGRDDFRQLVGRWKLAHQP